MSMQDAMERFIAPMRAMFGDPPGGDPEVAERDYARALAQFPADVLERTADHFKFSATKRTWPLPAACIEEARRIAANKVSGPAQQFAWRVPLSAVLERGVTNNKARQLISQGVYPPGSIWVPGAYDSGREHFGDLYGPDPDWRQPHPIGGEDGGAGGGAVRGEAGELAKGEGL